MEAWITWLIIILILSFIEIITINLVTIWFVASAAVALVVSLFIDSFYIEFIIFGVCGFVLMILTRPLLLKLLKIKDKEATNLDRVIGMNAICTEEISRNKVGEVKVDGKRWSATSQSKINVGDEVIITNIDGVKRKVKKGE